MLRGPPISVFQRSRCQCRLCHALMFDGRQNMLMLELVKLAFCGCELISFLRGFRGRQLFALELINVAQHFCDSGILLGGNLLANLDILIQHLS